jgi:molybdenum cofactor cytidylyltransferase
MNHKERPDAKTPGHRGVAAGRGSRFHGDGHKLEQQLAPGSAADTVLAATLRQVLATQLPVVVVTTDKLAPLAHHLVAARDIVELPRQDRQGARPLGMGLSIAAGVAANDADGWLVLPATCRWCAPTRC